MARLDANADREWASRSSRFPSVLAVLRKGSWMSHLSRSVEDLGQASTWQCVPTELASLDWVVLFGFCFFYPELGSGKQRA